ncbi:MAG TPA: amidohydrolase family protein [Acidobacteriaceae bacterium]|nr:amidohydrolase family protein [Acidobacteriaceae bacterium]
MILDANAFLGKWPYWPTPRSTPAEVVEELRGLKIDRAAVCSTRSIFVNWEDGNCETQVAATSFPEALIPFACLGSHELSHMWNPADYGFDRYAERGFRGIRLYPQHHSYHLLFESFIDEILEDAAARRWPVVLPLRVIMNWGVPSLDPVTMHAIVTRHPRVTWILAGVNYLHELQMATALMLKSPTVYLETSCVMGYAAIEKTVHRCGHAQLLFGSGLPLQHGGASLSKIIHAEIPCEAREAILGGNLQRLLGH